MSAVKASGNCARFAACPLTGPGTAADVWLDALAGAPTIDLSEYRSVVVVAAHPDDETFGFGATSATLAALGVHVRAVVVSDGGAAQSGLSAAASRELAATRHAELLEAATVLALRPPLALNIPDGAVAAHEDELADLLAKILSGARTRTLCVANWRGDGHPDHEAVGRAAARASATCGIPLLEYPIWMWHWASVGDPAVPWDRLAVPPTTDDAADRKAAAAQCYHSQLAHAGNAIEPVLPPFVVDRLLQVPEVVFH